MMTKHDIDVVFIKNVIDALSVLVENQAASDSEKTESLCISDAKSHLDKGHPVGWAAYIEIERIKEILTPRFARLVEFARASGLIDGILSHNSELVQSVGQQRISFLEGLRKKYR